jgi:hypothetical protein
MRMNHLASRLSIRFCILLLVTIFAALGFSQEPQQPVRTTMIDIQLQPGMQFEFEKFLKDELLPAMKQGGTKEMGVWKRAVFGQGGNYVFTMPMERFAEFDGPHPLFAAVGQHGAQAMLSKLNRFADSVRIYTITQLPDLDIAPAEGYVPKIGVQVRTTIAPGRNEEYEKIQKVITENIKKTNAKGFYADRVFMGGNPNQYLFLVHLESFADMDAFGQAFSKAMSETKVPSSAGIVTQIEYSTYAYDPELSIQSAE